MLNLLDPEENIMESVTEKMLTIIDHHLSYDVHSFTFLTA